MTKEKTVDHKTARLIEEMEKSLHNMERSLGQDHLVIAKILDSYARLLRQNNLRHIDALNMEARAKAIRAKHNQKEAENQAKGLDPIVHTEKMVSSGQVRFALWLVSLVVLVGFVVGAFTVVRSVYQIPRAKHSVPGANDLKLSTTYEDRDPQTGELQSTTTITTSNEPAKQMTIFEIASHLMRIKALAKEQLEIGRKAEKDKDFTAATAAYQAVIDAEEDSGKKLGRQAHSEEIAQCYEGYARMMEIGSDPQSAEAYQKQASFIRAHSR